MERAPSAEQRNEKMNVLATPIFALVHNIIYSIYREKLYYSLPKPQRMRNLSYYYAKSLEASL